jgi:hypothetical protein
VILGLLSMLAANVAVTLGALSITQRVSSGRRSMDAVLILLVRYILIAVAVLATGLARCLNPGALGILALLGIAAWAASGEQRRLPRLSMPELGWPLWLAMAVVVGRLLWQVWFFAPYSVDPLSYHLPKMAQWIQQGALLPYPGADVRETFPAGFELLETWWCVFLHHDVLIEMAGVEFLALGAAATAALARSAGIGLRGSVVAAGLYAITPAPMLHATGCMNDGPVAAVQLAALALAAGRGHPLLIASALAVGVGLKPTFASVVPGVALLYYLGRRTPLLPLQSKACAVTLNGVAMLVGSFWYGLNVVRFGNPLYPVGSLDTVGKASHRGFGLLGSRLNDLVGQAIYDDRDQTTVQFILTSGWGLVMFACGGVALIAMARSNPALRRLAPAFGITLLVALLLAPAGSFYLRFILCFPALGAIAAVALCERLPALSPIVATTAIFCFLSTLRPGDLSAGKLQTLMGDDWRVRSVDRNRDVTGTTIVCFTGTHDDSNGESYRMYGPDFSHRVVYLAGVRSVDELLEQLQRNGTPWLFAQARNGDGTSQKVVLEALRQGRLYRWDYGMYGPSRTK